MESKINISKVNQSNTVKPVRIAAHYSKKPSPEYENIQDPHYKKILIYPPPAEYKVIYDLWEKHQSCFWSSSENKPENDFDKFIQADLKLQTITLEMVACLMHGDSVVLDVLSNNDLLQSITVEQVQAFLNDQKAREMIHKAVYSKMLDISPDAEYYRGTDFVSKRLQPFMKFANKYKDVTDIRVLLYCIMLCEQIMFAPMFHQICYLATTGYAQNLCKANELVMRDEYLHYHHARVLLSSCKVLLDKTLADDLLNDMIIITKTLIDDIIDDYVSKDKLYNKDIAQKHFNYIIHNFKSENMLYESKSEYQLQQEIWNTSPAQSYITDVELDIKSNLMESESTIYGQCGDNTPINMNRHFTKK